METADHNQALLDANRDRLQVLELQAATYGNETPPHILVEMRKIVATIRALTTVADLTPDIDPDQPQEVLARDKVERRRDASTNEQATLRMIATVQATVAEVSNVKSAVRQDVQRLEQQITDVQTEVREQLTDAKERVNHQIATIEASVANVQTVVLTEIQSIHTTIDNIVKNSLRAIGVVVLLVGLVIIGLAVYFRV